MTDQGPPNERISLSNDVNPLLYNNKFIKQLHALTEFCKKYPDLEEIALEAMLSADINPFDERDILKIVHTYIQHKKEGKND